LAQANLAPHCYAPLTSAPRRAMARQRRQDLAIARLAPLTQLPGFFFDPHYDTQVYVESKQRFLPMSNWRHLLRIPGGKEYRRWRAASDQKGRAIVLDVPGTAFDPVPRLQDIEAGLRLHASLNAQLGCDCPTLGEAIRLASAGMSEPDLELARSIQRAANVARHVSLAATFPSPRPSTTGSPPPASARTPASPTESQGAHTAAPAAALSWPPMPVTPPAAPSRAVPSTPPKVCAMGQEEHAAKVPGQKAAVSSGLNERGEAIACSGFVAATINVPSTPPKDCAPAAACSCAGEDGKMLDDYMDYAGSSDAMSVGQRPSEQVELAHDADRSDASLGSTAVLREVNALRTVFVDRAGSALARWSAWARLQRCKAIGPEFLRRIKQEQALQRWALRAARRCMTPCAECVWPVT